MPEMNTDAAAGGSEQTRIAVFTTEGEGSLSVTNAARTLAQARNPAPGSERGPKDRKDSVQRATPGSVQAEGASPHVPTLESTRT